MMTLPGTVAKATLITLPLVAVLLSPSTAAAQVVDLVDHNGFEECWSKAITKSTFLDLIQASLNDKTLCVGKVSGSATGLS